MGLLRFLTSCNGPAMVLRMRAFFALALVVLSTGCEPSLGECDAMAARRVVYRFSAAGSMDDGVAMYAGQALLLNECATCHSNTLSGVSRIGAPAEFDFNVRPACVGVSNRGDCVGDDEFGRLRVHRDRVHDFGSLIMAEVESGRMPPGAAGQTANRGAATLYRAIGNESRMPERPLPMLAEPEGREILRNWLACGAPVVEATILRELGRPGQACSASDDEGDVGWCVIQAPAMIEPIEPPTWTNIYQTVIGREGLCTQCHDPSAVGPFGEAYTKSMLDFTSSDAAYDGMVGAMAIGEDCESSGQMLVPPGGTPMSEEEAEASLLMRKLRADPTVCGDAMPPADRIPGPWVDSISQWIQNGANRD